MARHVRIHWLLRGDLLNLGRDPLLLVAAIAPLLIAAVLRFFVPLLSGLLETYLSFALAPHYPFIVSFFILLPGLLFGMIVGFFIVDERDEDILVYFSVTPLSKGGYLGYRLLMPTTACFFAAFLLVYATGLIRFSPFALLPVALIAAAEAPLITLFLGAFAANKVEALALSKAVGIFLVAPFAGYLVPAPWHLFAGLFPPYWVSKAFLSGFDGHWGFFLLYTAGGILIHGLYAVLLLRVFERRIS